MINKIFLILLWILIFPPLIKPFSLALGITLNPYGKTPLSAVYVADQVNEYPLAVTVLGKVKARSVSYVYPAGYGTVFPIHGLYSKYTNTIYISSLDQQGNSTVAETNKLFIGDIYQSFKKEHPAVKASKVKVHIDKLEKNDPFNQDFYFVYDNYTNIVAYDNKGCLRYLYDNDETILTRIEQKEEQMLMLFVDKKMFQVNLLGQKKYIPAGCVNVHHESFPKNNNNIVLGTSKFGLDDRVLEINSSGKLERDLFIGDVFRNVLSTDEKQELSKTVYDYRNIFTNRITQNPEAVDWAHANSLVYHQEKDILYLSLRHLGVVAVDYSEWKLLWWLADDRMNTKKGKGYGYVPADFVYLDKVKPLEKYRMYAESYPRNQHTLLLRSNGNLLMFDNRGDRDINFQGSRAVEYQFDDFAEPKQARIVRQYRHPRRFYSRILSDVDMTGNDHENWLLLWGYDNPYNPFKTTRLVEINADNQVLFDMSLRVDWIYRVEKKPFYPYADKQKKYSIDVSEINGL